MTAVYILLGIAGLVLLWAVLAYNRLVAGRNGIEAAWSQIDVQLKRRRDLIPNLVEVVKDYMAYEQETLQRVIDARARTLSARTRGEQIEAEGMLGAALGRLVAVAEAYPDLKANQQVAQLMEELTATENKIAFARQHYNDQVLAQNTRVETLPSSIVAGLFRFGRHVYFEVPEEEKALVEVDLR